MEHYNPHPVIFNFRLAIILSYVGDIEIEHDYNEHLLYVRGTGWEPPFIITIVNRIPTFSTLESALLF